MAALAASDALRRYAMAPPAYAQWQQRLRLAGNRTAPVIDRIEIAETRFVNPETIRHGISQKEGERLDAEQLARDLVLEYSQGDLHSLDYSVVGVRDKTVLRITPVEKPWGPDYLRFGFGMASDFRAESAFNARALYRRTWLNSLGGEWLFGGQIGSRQNVATEFYQPLDLRHIFFVRGAASTELRKVPLFSGGDRLGVYRIQENRAEVDAGANIGVWGQASAGWLERSLGAVLDSGPDTLLNSSARVGGPSAALAIDTYDQPFFPTRGYKLDASFLDVRYVRSSSGVPLEPYSRGEVRFGAAFSRNRFTTLVAVEGGTTANGTLPLGDAFTLGGPRHLAGFAQDQLIGGEYLYGRLDGQYRLNFASPLYGLTLIAGVSVEAGRMNKQISEPSLTGWQRSLSAYLGANTFLGPVYIGVADAKNGKGRFYLIIGTP